jgi:hypothetical protein
MGVSKIQRWENNREPCFNAGAPAFRGGCDVRRRVFGPADGESGPNARSAPKGWEVVVADLAEKHANELEARVTQLRTLAAKLHKDRAR